MKKIPTQEYTAELKEQAAKRTQEVGIGVVGQRAGDLVVIGSGLDLKAHWRKGSSIRWAWRARKAARRMARAP